MKIVIVALIRFHSFVAQRKRTGDTSYETKTKHFSVRLIFRTTKIIHQISPIILYFA